MTKAFFKKLSKTQRSKKKILRGEHTIFFLACIMPLFMLFMGLAVDYGGYLVMRSMSRVYCDTAVVAGSQAIDLSRNGGTYDGNDHVLNEHWAEERARQTFALSVANKVHNPLTDRMTFKIDSVKVNGAEITVQVSASYRTIWRKGQEMRTMVRMMKGFEIVEQ